MITHLLLSDDLDALEAEFAKRGETESVVWLAALDLLRQRRRESFARRTKLARTPRKTLGLRYSR